MNRRQALAQFAAFVTTSPLLRGDRKYSEIRDPIFEAVNVMDMGRLAKKKLDPLAWDYLDEGSEDEAALRDNRRGFDNIIIRPHFLLHDVSKVDISMELFGRKLLHPIFLCPTGGKNCVFPNGDVDTAVAAATSNTMMIATAGSNSVLGSAKGPSNWWQFTTATEFRSQNQMKEWSAKLKDRGCTGISVTVDIYHVSHRERSVRNRLVRGWCNGSGIPRDAAGKVIYEPDDLVWTTGDYPPSRSATPTWDTLQRLREATSLPVIVKGILTSEDTQRAVKYGMSGIVVSNHGARQLDQVGGTIEALPECVEAANGKIPVLLDGGIRRGTDIFKALALGASAVGIGRPYLWGLGAFGNRGIERVIELLRAELAVDMGMAGVGRISQIDRSFVRIRN